MANLRCFRRESELLEPKWIQVSTWNVNRVEPPEDLQTILGLSRGPDLIAIGLQETSLYPHETLRNMIFTEKWTKSFDKILKYKGYKRVKSVRIVGVVLNLYVKENQRERVTILDYNSLSTGLNGLYGHKGGVWLKIKYRMSVISFVTARLSSGYHKLEKRIEEYHAIERKRARNPTQDNYTFWFGNLNFTLTDASVKIPTMLNDNNYHRYLGSDELNLMRSLGRVFEGYQEHPINFKPTYKYFPTTTLRDWRCHPAWTDRILYRSSIDGQINTLHYGIISTIKSSDHIPVESVYQIFM